MTFKSYYGIILEQLKIVAPAVKDLKTGNVIKGRRGELHMNVYDRMIHKLAITKKMTYQKAEKIFDNKFRSRFESGFIDNEGNYYTRQEAFELSKQKLKEKDPIVFARREDGEMQSEDIPVLG